MCLLHAAGLGGSRSRCASPRPHTLQMTHRTRDNGRPTVLEPLCVMGGCRSTVRTVLGEALLAMTKELYIFTATNAKQVFLSSPMLTPLGPCVVRSIKLEVLIPSSASPATNRRHHHGDSPGQRPRRAHRAAATYEFSLLLAIRWGLALNVARLASVNHVCVKFFSVVFVPGPGQCLARIKPHRTLTAMYVAANWAAELEFRHVWANAGPGSSSPYHRHRLNSCTVPLGLLPKVEQIT